MPFDIEIDEYHEDEERKLRYFDKFKDSKLKDIEDHDYGILEW